MLGHGIVGFSNLNQWFNGIMPDPIIPIIDGYLSYGSRFGNSKRNFNVTSKFGGTNKVFGASRGNLDSV